MLKQWIAFVDCTLFRPGGQGTIVIVRRSG